MYTITSTIQYLNIILGSSNTSQFTIKNIYLVAISSKPLLSTMTLADSTKLIYKIYKKFILLPASYNI